VRLDISGLRGFKSADGVGAEKRGHIGVPFGKRFAHLRRFLKSVVAERGEKRGLFGSGDLNAHPSFGLRLELSTKPLLFIHCRPKKLTPH
jgi:hypothetical protein